jgi:diguanylate cyclase (GGDEF)-like protein
MGYAGESYPIVAGRGVPSVVAVQVEEPPGQWLAARRLHALTEIAKAVATAPTVEQVARACSAAVRQALEASSLSLSVWERENGHVRVLLNDGELGAGEEYLPNDEVYALTEPELSELLFEDGRAYLARVDADPTDPDFDEGLVQLLRQTNKGSCLGVPVVLEGRVWGELFVTRRVDQPAFAGADLDYAVAVAAQVAAGIAQAQHLQRVAGLAYVDPLTGLANRRAIDERLDAAMERHRSDGTVVSLLVADVNGLKRINDEQGHEAGDRALVHFSGALSTAAGLVPGSLAGRTGGDEFCIIIEGRPADHAVMVAEDLCRRALASLTEGVACGVASTGDRVGVVATPARLFRLADAAQSRAKRSRFSGPVVAGRGLPAETSTRVAALPSRRRDRRTLRGTGPVEPARLLEDVLATLDHAGPVSIPDRLELVADAVARGADGPAWWVSTVEAGSRELRTVGRSHFRRAAAEPATGPAGTSVDQAVFDLAGYPLTVAALDGQGCLVEAGSPTGDPAEQAILDAGGFTGVLLAGGRDGAGAGWLVEVYLDEISVPGQALVPVLRALVACALVGARHR